MSVIKTKDGYMVDGTLLSEQDVRTLAKFLRQDEIEVSVRRCVDRNGEGAYDKLPESLQNKLIQECESVSVEQYRDFIDSGYERVLDYHSGEIYDILHPAISLKRLYAYLSDGKGDSVKTAFGEIRHSSYTVSHHGEDFTNDIYEMFADGRLVCEDGNRLFKSETAEDGNVILSSWEFDEDVKFRMTAREYSIAVKGK